MKIYLILFLFAFLLPLETQAKNHNKTITKKEFLDSQMKILEARFNAVDTNKDGKITPEEKKKFAEKINKQRLALLKKIDTNKDGKISKEEEKAYIEKNKKKVKK